VDATFYGIQMVVLALLLAVGGLALVEYLVPWQVRQRHNDVAGFICAVLGVVYAVWLGFVTIAAWEDF
jgi:formate-dependent nitrite reductase membrane component NrfD